MLSYLLDRTLLPAIMGPMGFECVRFTISRHHYHHYGWSLLAHHKDDTQMFGYEIFYVTAADAFLASINSVLPVLSARYGERHIEALKEEIIKQMTW